MGTLKATTVAVQVSLIVAVTRVKQCHLERVSQIFALCPAHQLMRSEGICDLTVRI
jgi:hypothetical protein